MDAAVTGWKPDGVAAGGFIHLINSGATTMDGTGKQKINGKPAMKPYWEITAKEAGDCLDATSWRPADLGYFRGGGYSSDFLTEGGMPITMTRLNLVKGIGPVLQIAEGVTATLPDHVHDKLDKRTSETWPMDAAPSRRDARARLAAQFAQANCSGKDAAGPLMSVPIQCAFSGPGP